MKTDLKNELETNLEKIHNLNLDGKLTDKRLIEMENDIIRVMTEAEKIGKDPFRFVKTLNKNSDLSFIFHKILQNKVLEDNLFKKTDYKKSYIYQSCMLIDEKLTKEITEPVTSLIETYIDSDKENKTMVLMTAFKYLELEDENKRLTLTDEQYKTWLETDPQYINVKQFEILYGINGRQQYDYRAKSFDKLPAHPVGTKTYIYKRKEVEDWLSNYYNK